MTENAEIRGSSSTLSQGAPSAQCDTDAEQKSLNDRHTAVCSQRHQATAAVGAVLLLLVMAVGLAVWLDADFDIAADCSAVASPGVDWSGCHFVSLTADQADLRGIRFVKGVAPHASLRATDLAVANLQAANLREADLSHASLGGADLRDADLRGVNLAYANLYDADLSRANLRGADVQGAELHQAYLLDAIWVDGTRCTSRVRGICRPVSDRDESLPGASPKFAAKPPLDDSTLGKTAL